MRPVAALPETPRPRILATGALRPPAQRDRVSLAVLAIVLIVAAFLTVECCLPLGTAVQIGADEGFNLAKATLLLEGYRLYSDVWSDQPPLHTFLITQVLRHISPSILGPRIVTVCFAALLLASLFTLILRVSGLAVATLGTALVIASPGFIELASSCMLEIPALATGLAALTVLSFARPTKCHIREILSGLIFAAALQIKFSPAILLPLAGLLVASHESNKNDAGKQRLLGGGVFLVSIAIGWIAIDLVIDRGAYISHFHQSWISHFAAPKSSEYGSPADHPFDGRILLKNWDTTTPALVGIFFLLCNFRHAPTLPRSHASTPGYPPGSPVQRFNSSTLLPLTWLAISLGYFSIHRPWWTYYYIHIAIPLCWCAAIGVAQTSGLLYRRFPIGKPVERRATIRPKPGSSTPRRSTLPLFTLLVLFFLASTAWQVGRIYLQAAAIRNSPQTYYDLVLPELERYKPFTQWIYSDEPIYSFHAGIPVPPNLAVVSLKRLWSGDLTNEHIASELNAHKPGLVLLQNGSRPQPFQDLIDSEYRLAYQDDRHRLFTLRSISKKPYEQQN